MTESFLLTVGEYSDMTPVGVYTSLEKAKTAAQVYVQAATYYCADIWVVPVDQKAGYVDRVESSSSIENYQTPNASIKWRGQGDD